MVHTKYDTGISNHFRKALTKYFIIISLDIDLWPHPGANLVACLCTQRANALGIIHIKYEAGTLNAFEI